MALVSSSVPIHLRQQQLHGYSRSSSSSSRARSTSSLGEIEEEKQVEEVVEKVHVAVGKEYKESKETLIWLLQNVSKDKMVVLVHVHRPAQMIPMMGAKFPESKLTEEQVRGYRHLEKDKMNKTLDEYLALCSHAKVKAEKLVIEKDDIAKGIIELVAQHGITNLVMGAAADRQYSKKMKAPKSKTAISVQQHADQSCKIWFVCRGNLICTRDLNSSPQNKLRTRSLPQYGTDTLDWHVTERSISDKYDSNIRGNMAAISLETASNSSVDGSFIDLWEDVSRGSQPSDHSNSSVGDEVNVGSLQKLKDEESEKDSVMVSSVHEPGELRSSTPNIELEDDNVIYAEVHEMLQHALKEADESNVIYAEVYEMLQHALKEAAESKREAYEESCRRRKAEKDAIEAARKVKVSENLYAKELKQRKGIEETLTRERSDLEKLRTQHDKILEELQKASEKKAQMELKITESEQTIKNFQEKLSAAKNLLSSLQEEYKELQQSREDAIREIEELSQKRETASSTQGVMNFTEFTYSELERATNNFNDCMKIGEGGYGSVYKGFLRHTVVAIKLLNSQSMQGQTEFFQETEILSRVRHPHLVTLIGTCPEKCALVYEYLPQGSLEDHLECRDNTPPLPWHARTRIAAEICSALIFLHSYKPHTVVHGDLKPANILLDSNYSSKLGDFGICRLLVQSNTTTTLYKRTNPKGTLVYMDPEFISTGELTPRSDVYSFGVVLLRLLTGRRPLGIIKEVKEAVEGGRLHEILDVSAGNWPFVQAKQLAKLALKCCEIKRKNRPDLAQEVWRALEHTMNATSSMESISGNSCVPSYFICPISKEIMKDPRIAADGFTYEAKALKEWLDGGHETSPMTNLKLTHHDLIPNRALRSAIQEWLKKQK